MRKAAQIDLPPISNCARCGYDLRGNRVTTRCPECGLEYSLQDCTLQISGVVGLPSTPQLIAWGAIFIVCYWSDHLALFAVYMLIAFGLAPFMNLFYRWHGRGNVALRAEGIVCYCSNREERRIPWDDVRSIRLGGAKWRGWVLRVYITSWRWMRVLPCGKNKDDADELLRCAKLLWTAGKANAE